MEGPYRDLGSGFARLGGAEGLRRTPSRVSSVEDALLELLRNSYEAGAHNIYVASRLSKRRYRTLLVLDDGTGIHEAYKDLIFEPGVTNRHLHPNPHLEHHANTAQSSGLSLYHVKEKSENITVCNTSNPTAVKATFDTEKLPESALQSSTRDSKSNLTATARNFLSQIPTNGPKTKIYLSSPTRILATLIKTHIIQKSDIGHLAHTCRRLGFDISQRTLQRIKRRDIRPAFPIAVFEEAVSGSETLQSNEPAPYSFRTSSGSITLDRDERSQIIAILSRAARKSYLEVGELNVESRAGKIQLNAQLYEPEDEYE